MLKMKRIWFWLAGFLLSSAFAWAAPLQDYTISYTIKNPDGTVASFIKYYLRDGDKFRAEYISKDGVTHTINILRKDKGLVWSLDPIQKSYREVPLKQEAWESSVMGVSSAESPLLKKTGVTNFLNCACDIYEVENSGWSNTFVLEQVRNVIFRCETKFNGNIFQIREATDFSQGQPEESLFEIPDGYKLTQ